MIMVLAVIFSGCAQWIGVIPKNGILTPPTSNEQTSQNTQTTQTEVTPNPNPTAENTCPAGQYSCACATGSYCLKMGAMCLNPTSPCPVLTTDANKTQTYKNSSYDFQFDYPTRFTFTNQNYGNLDDKVVQLQLSSDAYPDTNLGDAAFSVTVGTAKSLDACLTMNAPEGGTGFKESTLINGVKFYASTGNGAGAGNFYDSKIYRTLVSSECLEIVETIHTGNIGNYEPGTVKEIDKTPIWKDLENILSTFNLVSAPRDITLPTGYTLDNYTVEKTLDTVCTKKDDCETPVEYLMMSRCPFTSLCLQGKCTVVCPSY